jgi:hypothetical protein
MVLRLGSWPVDFIAETGQGGYLEGLGAREVELPIRDAVPPQRTGRTTPRICGGLLDHADVRRFGRLGIPLGLVGIRVATKQGVCSASTSCSGGTCKINNTLEPMR